MTLSMRLVHEGCKSGHFTVGGADDDLRKALAINRSRWVHRGRSRALSVASRAGMSLKTQYSCGLAQFRPAPGRPGPGERQRRRGGKLRAGNSASWHLLRDKVTRGLSSLSAVTARSTELAEPPGPRPPSSRPALPPPAPLWPPLAPVQRRDTVATIAVGSAARPRRNRGAVPAYPCCPGGVQSRAQRKRASYGAI